MKAMYTEHMGSDHSIANTARVSMEELGSLGWHDLPNGYSEEKCEKLLNYLAKHNHLQLYKTTG